MRYKVLGKPERPGKAYFALLEPSVLCLFRGNPRLSRPRFLESLYSEYGFKKNIALVKLMRKADSMSDIRQPKVRDDSSSVSILLSDSETCLWLFKYGCDVTAMTRFAKIEEGRGR